MVRTCRRDCDVSRCRIRIATWPRRRLAHGASASLCSSVGIASIPDLPVRTRNLLLREVDLRYPNPEVSRRGRVHTFTDEKILGSSRRWFDRCPLLGPGIDRIRIRDLGDRSARIRQVRWSHDTCSIDSHRSDCPSRHDILGLEVKTSKNSRGRMKLPKYSPRRTTAAPWPPSVS